MSCVRTNNIIQWRRYVEALKRVSPLGKKGKYFLKIKNRCVVAFSFIIERRASPELGKVQKLKKIAIDI